MTLIVAVTAPGSIWMLADRRLSKFNKPVTDDARKMIYMDAMDGVAIVGYAGLGSTIHGTEPSDWMQRVLRGRYKLPLEKSLGIIASAMRAQLPRHMKGLPGSAHYVMAPAFRNGKPELYEIDLAIAAGGVPHLEFKRHVNRALPNEQAPRLGVAGSGAAYLMKDRSWQRELLRLVKFHAAGKVAPVVVADHLAALNYRVHRAVASVGPNCTVVWRFQKGGGRQQSYLGLARGGTAQLPISAGGFDVRALAKAMLPIMSATMDKLLRGEKAEPDSEAIKAALATVPDTPDENLR